jgi:hypothetical protein
VEIGGIEIEVRVAAAIEGSLQKAWICSSRPWQMRLTSEREIPVSEPMAATRAST